MFNSNEPNAIIQAFISNNADKLDGLTKNDFEVVGDVTNTSLTLKVKDDQQKYQGSITINFTVKINISSLDLNPNTGVFNSNEPNAIIQAFISNNADKLDGLTKNDFEVVGDVTNTSLTLKVKDDQQKYQGSITINFTVKTDETNSKQPEKQNNKTAIIASLSSVGGVGVLGPIVAFFRRRKRK
ncbi:hypothetical protein JIY74_30040 [Vibrio harveyi]|nr:hypothetical protein [Vibrio harveyi]